MSDSWARGVGFVEVLRVNAPAATAESARGTLADGSTIDAVLILPNDTFDPREKLYAGVRSSILRERLGAGLR
jgi:hypothetical protein